MRVRWDGAQLRRVGSAAEVVPGIDEDAAVCRARLPDNLPGQRGAGDAGPGHELQRHLQAVGGGAFAERREALRHDLERRQRAQRLDATHVELSRANGVCQGVEVGFDADGRAPAAPRRRTTSR